MYCCWVGGGSGGGGTLRSWITMITVGEEWDGFCHVRPVYKENQSNCFVVCSMEIRQQITQKK